MGYPFSKEVSPKINELQAITFYDRHASDAQTCLAPPKRQFLENKIFHPNTKWLKSFLVPGPGFRHKLSRLPLRQGSLPKNKPTSGNNF